jgi:hypothetical protein
VFAMQDTRRNYTTFNLDLSSESWEYLPNNCRQRFKLSDPLIRQTLLMELILK